MTQEEMQAEIERLKQLIAQKDEVIQKQSVQIENMMQVLLHARKERFGAKSEGKRYTVSRGALTFFLGLI